MITYTIKKWDTIKSLYPANKLINDIIDNNIIDIISMSPFPIINTKNPEQLVVVFTLHNNMKIIHDLFYLKKWLESIPSSKEPTTNITLSPNVLVDIRHHLRESTHIIFKLSVKSPTLFGIKKGKEIQRKPLNNILFQDDELYVLIYVKKQPSFSNGFIAYLSNDEKLNNIDSIQQELVQFASNENYPSYDFLYDNVKIIINVDCLTFILEGENIKQHVYENLSYLIKYIVNTIIIKHTAEVNNDSIDLFINKIRSWTRKKLTINVH
jgi:hypothetical protein